jgi:UDP-sulfoquinovose synthase
MRVIVFGGDGFCGWPTSLHLAKSGHNVLIVDNLIRRQIDVDLGSNSLTPIAKIEERMNVAKDVFGNIEFQNFDVSQDVETLRQVIKFWKPDSIIQFAEQRAAPFSMIDDKSRRYTVDNNIIGTHNICSAIVDIDPNIHLIHLGTMGVYGYSKEFGQIPEGYLDITINSTGSSSEILYPANPGSIYHMSKCLDQLIFQFYNKNWGLRVTDLHQGIVWGVQTEETRMDEALINRFDYDGIYGTVLNRFLSQSVNNTPLTVYGTGGQARAFIHISDTAKCLKIAIESAGEHKFDRVRIMNQVSEVKTVLDLAKLISAKTKTPIEFLENPRKELSENELEVANENFLSLGFKPVLLDEQLLDDVMVIAQAAKNSYNSSVVYSSPKW